MTCIDYRNKRQTFRKVFGANDRQHRMKHVQYILLLMKGDQIIIYISEGML